MSMTTLLTLASMFGGLVDVTPKISYTTKLDVWMITCIVFVFGTLAEFTTVIFLKYYLQNLPTLDLSTNDTKTITPTSSANPGDNATITSIDTALGHSIVWGGKDETVNRFLGETINSALRTRKDSTKERPESKRKWNLKNQTKAALPVKVRKVEEILDDDASEDEEDILEERRLMAESIIKRIEKYSVVVYFLIFLFFNIYYWTDIILCSNSNLEKFRQNSYYDDSHQHAHEKR